MSVLAFVALSLLPVRRWRGIPEQLRAGRSPSDILDEECQILSERSSSAVRSAPLLERAARAMTRGTTAGLRAIALNDPDYPLSLAMIVDPSPVLWVAGHAASFSAPAVAIVGSRAGSPYAIAAAERLALDLADRGVVVVSGMARGVDAAAHRGAIAARGSTIAVLGCGTDVVYPPEHAQLAKAIAAVGALVSELPPGTQPRPRFFPQRNRLISGLSRAVVVVEAGPKSGSLITARCALEQGREVLAVPGSILHGRNRGGHALLRDGAKVVETADDILEELGIGPEGMPARYASPAEPGAEPGGSNPDAILAALIPGEACDIDALVERTGLPPGRLLPRLLELELAGSVRRVGGGRFVRF